MAKFCSNCGKSVNDDVAFCDGCGGSLKTETENNSQKQPQKIFSQKKKPFTTLAIISGALSVVSLFLAFFSRYYYLNNAGGWSLGGMGLLDNIINILAHITLGLIIISILFLILAIVLFILGFKAKRKN